MNSGRPEMGNLQRRKLAIPATYPGAARVRRETVLASISFSAISALPELAREKQPQRSLNQQRLVEDSSIKHESITKF
jgi:hypothetical protein